MITIRLQYRLLVLVSFFFLSFSVAQALFPVPVFAAADCASQASSSSGRAIIQPVGLPQIGCGSSLDIVTRISRIAFAALAMFSLLFIVIGGLKYTASGGDSNAIASAKKTILYAIVGFVLGVSVFTILSFVVSQVPTP